MADDKLNQKASGEPEPTDEPEATSSGTEAADMVVPEEQQTDEVPADMLEEEAPLTEQELEQLRAEEVAFSWQASEYVHHHKDTKWYVGLAVGVIILVAAAALLQSWLSIALFLVMTAAIVVYAKKPPRVLLYELSPSGVKIEGKPYPFSLFRSFSVMRDTEWHSIDLEPTKRLMPRLTLLFDDADYDEIVGHLELHLPRVDRDPDFVERLSRYLRF